MYSNTFGRLFSFTGFGESHGPSIGCVVDGCPSLVPLSEEDIQPMLDRRRPGGNPFVSPRREPDRIRILSGLYEGKTTGHPICLLIENQARRPIDYEQMRDIFRPGHADAAYFMKYGVHDHRGGGRSSARETAVRVAAAAVARKMLAQYPETAGIKVTAGLVQLGQVSIDAKRWDDAAINSNPLFCPDAAAALLMQDELEIVAGEGDSLGGVIEVRAEGVPPGLGEPVYDKLDARIAQACMGVNAAKGVEIGDGFAAAAARGSGNNDQMRSPVSGRFPDAFLTNHAGGVLGGVSTGQPLIVRVAFKPTPSISRSQLTVDRELRDAEISVGGRHDPAAVVRAAPVLEAMLWLVLADFFLLARVGK